MYWPELTTTFRFANHDPHITAFQDPGGRIDVIWDTYRRSVLPMALQANGLEALHASAVVVSSGVVAFCAVSETGKSTLAFGLRRKGFPQWADDGVVFHGGGAAMTTLPLPFEVRLRPESRDMFGDNAPCSTRFQHNGPGEQIHVAPAGLSAICLLRRVNAGSFISPARIRRVAPAEAFPAVLTHAHVFDPFDLSRREQMIGTYLDLVARVPVFDVAFAPVRDGLDGLLDVIAEALRFEVPAPAASVCAS
jgi:hypothetical protein